LKNGENRQVFYDPAGLLEAWQRNNAPRRIQVYGIQPFIKAMTVQTEGKWSCAHYEILFEPAVILVEKVAYSGFFVGILYRAGIGLLLKEGAVNPVQQKPVAGVAYHNFRTGKKGSVPGHVKISEG
jgi:hypothetical protein